MSNGIKYFITFVLGAAAGSVAAWAILKPKYERAKDEEVEEVREYYTEKYSNTLDKMSKLNKVAREAVAYKKMVTDLGYSSDSDEEYQEENEIEQEGGSGTLTFNPTDEVPQVITPEEFAADDEYQAETLTLYSDGVLTDDFDNPIEDVPAMVGDALDHFGEYEDDSVFVRNDRYKCNYEILKDDRTFDEVKNRTLNLVEDDE